jgi:hypothetical protein
MNIARFAELIREESASLDNDNTSLHRAYHRWQEANLAVTDFHPELAALASVSGAFAFLILQEAVAGKPGHGVAFGHLRTGKGPRWASGRVSGTVPWMTGAGFFHTVRLGVLLPDGSEAYTFIPAHDRPEFRHNKPMKLMACSSMQTVSVSLTNLAVSESDFTRIDTPGSAARANANGLVGHTPLLFGNIQASLSHICNAPRVSYDAKARAASKMALLETQRTEALADPTLGGKFRANAVDTAIRLATLAAMANGSASLQSNSDTERVYREALVFAQMAQTDAIVESAFETVLSL